MNWTTATPTQPGPYWLREDGETPRLVEFSPDFGGEFVDFGDEVPCSLNLSTECLWFGPIQPPLF